MPSSPLPIGSARVRAAKTPSSTSVSLTALLCSPTLSWQAALACYYTFQSQGTSRTVAAPSVVDRSGHRKQGVPSLTGQSTSLPQSSLQLRQARLRQQMHEADAADQAHIRHSAHTEAAPSTLHTGSRERATSAAQGHGSMTPEAVFCLYHRLVAACGVRPVRSSGPPPAERTGALGGEGLSPHVARAFLAHAAARQPLLSALNKTQENEGKTLEKAAPLVNPSAVLNAALVALLHQHAMHPSGAEEPSTATAPRVTSEPAMEKAHSSAPAFHALRRVMQNCESLGLIAHYVRDTANAIGTEEETAPTLAPSFTPFLQELDRQWERAFAQLRRDSSPGQQGLGNGAWQAAAERHPRPPEGDADLVIHEPSTDNTDDAVAVSLARALFPHASEDLPTPEAALAPGKGTVSSTLDLAEPFDGNEGKAPPSLHALARDTITAISFISQMRICRTVAIAPSRAAPSALMEEGRTEEIVELQEREWLCRLLQRAVPFCGFAQLRALLLSVCDAERYLLSHAHCSVHPNPSVGATEPTPRGIRLIQDMAPLLEVMLASAIAAAGGSEDMMSAISPLCHTEHQRPPKEPTPAIRSDMDAPSLLLLPPLVCSSSVVRALTNNPSLTRGCDDDESISRHLKELYMGLETHENTARIDRDTTSPWELAFLGHSRDRSAGATADTPMRIAPFPQCLTRAAEIYGQPVPTLLEGWASGCVAVAHWLPLCSSASTVTPEAVLGHALAAAAMGMSTHPETLARTGARERVPCEATLRNLFYQHFLPAAAVGHSVGSYAHQPGVGTHVAVLSVALKELLSPVKAGHGGEDVDGDETGGEGLFRNQNATRHAMGITATEALLRGLLTPPEVSLKNRQATREDAAVARASTDHADIMVQGNDATTEQVQMVRLMRHALCRWVRTREATLEQAAHLLGCLLRVMDAPMLKNTLSESRDELIAAFRDAVNTEGFRLEEQTTTAATPHTRFQAAGPQPSRAEEASRSEMGEMERWLGLLRVLPRGAADEVHLTVWLYWLLRAVARCEDTELNQTRAGVGGASEVNDASVLLAMLRTTTTTGIPSTPSVSRSRACSEHQAMAVAANLGSHLRDFPMNAVAPPMVLNWVVSRVPRLSWAEAAGVLRQGTSRADRQKPFTAPSRIHQDEGPQTKKREETASERKASPMSDRTKPVKPGAVMSERRAPAFVYLALPVDRIQDMQHAVRVLGSLREANRDAAERPTPNADLDRHAVVDQEPSREKIQALYEAIRSGLLWTWYARSLHAVLSYVAAVPVERAVLSEASPTAAMTQTTTEPSSLHLEDGNEGVLLTSDEGPQVALASVTGGATATVTEGNGSGSGGAIRIPVPLLGHLVLQERHVHQQFLNAVAMSASTTGLQSQSPPPTTTTSASVETRRLTDRIVSRAHRLLLGDRSSSSSSAAAAAAAASALVSASSPSARAREVTRAVAQPMGMATSTTAGEKLRHQDAGSRSAEELPPVDEHLGGLLFRIKRALSTRTGEEEALSSPAVGAEPLHDLKK